MLIKIKVGPKGQIVIPKVVREFLGIKAGDEIVMEIRGKELLIKSKVDPEKFVDDFCSTTKRKLTEKVDLKKIVREEVEERLALH